ncbi:MAG: transcriptional repressor [Bacteroidales bacterium]|nr:transcriptional repressor [Bacteroidales bacterium]
MSEVLNNSAIIKNFNDFLEQGNYRKTPERAAVLNEALAFAKPFTADQLLEALQSTTFRVSQSAVYANLELMVAAGIFSRFFNEGLRKLQFTRVSDEKFVHLVCLRCGKVKIVKDQALAQELHAKRYAAFTEHYRIMCVNGVCNSCARSEKKQKTKL